MKRNTSLTYESSATYFVTTTVTEFTEIFNKNELAEILKQNISFYVKDFRAQLHAFVIMPNHIHLLLTMGEKGNISELIGRIKEYSAKQIIKYCKDNGEQGFLSIFEFSADKYRPDHKYQVWQSRFDDFRIRNQKQFSQKFEYIHNNPLQERWKLVENMQDYKYSSAGFYLDSRDIGIEIIPFAGWRL